MLDFVICEGYAEALLACVSVCIFVLRISLCTRVVVTASAREHGETLFIVLGFFFFRRLDCMTAADGGVRECGVGGGGGGGAVAGLDVGWERKGRRETAAGLYGG